MRVLFQAGESCYELPFVVQVKNYANAGLAMRHAILDALRASEDGDLPIGVAKTSFGARTKEWVAVLPLPRLVELLCSAHAYRIENEMSPYGITSP